MLRLSVRWTSSPSYGRDSECTMDFQSVAHLIDGLEVRRTDAFRNVRRTSSP